MLGAGPEERRGFIEEAAGVLKHRKRKEKALRKLEAMQANLDRLEDLTAEIRRQLTPLGRQARTARRAQRIQHDVRDARARLLADDLVQARTSLAVDEDVADILVQEGFTSIEEIALGASADTRTGFRSITLEVSVNGEPRLSLPLDEHLPGVARQGTLVRDRRSCRLRRCGHGEQGCGGTKHGGSLSVAATIGHHASRQTTCRSEVSTLCGKPRMRVGLVAQRVGAAVSFADLAGAISLAALSLAIAAWGWSRRQVR